MYNTYSKTVAFLEVVEYLDSADARVAIKLYFERLIEDLDLNGTERANDEGQLEDDMKNQAAFSLSIKDIKWKLVLLRYRTMPNDPNELSSGVDPREIVIDNLETVLAKNKFFDREELILPTRFCVMGGSEDLQLLCQNFGSLFEVGKCDQLRPNLFYTDMIFVYLLPFEDSRLAHYISSIDPWYRRHVHSVFYYKNMMPDDNYVSMRENNAAQKKAGKTAAGSNFANTDFEYKSIPPELLEYRYINRMMQHYFTFANQSVVVPIYKVEGSHPGRMLGQKEPAHW